MAGDRQMGGDSKGDSFPQCAGTDQIDRFCDGYIGRDRGDFSSVVKKRKGIEAVHKAPSMLFLSKKPKRNEFIIIK